MTFSLPQLAKFRNLVLIPSAVALILSASSAFAETVSTEEWQISADKVTRYDDPQSIVAEGNIVLKKIRKLPPNPVKKEEVSEWAELLGESPSKPTITADEIQEDVTPVLKTEVTIKADWIAYDVVLGNIKARGNIVIEGDEDTLYAEKADINLTGETGTFSEAKIIRKDKDLHFEGEEIAKTGLNSYHIENGWVITCKLKDGETPPWSLSSSDTTINPNGYAVMKHAKFNVKGVPVFYTPYMVVPIKSTRQTGFLFPEISSSSNNGFGFNLPFFINISDSTDMTLFPEYYYKRGLMPGLEFRYVQSAGNKGSIMGSYLDDQLTDPSETEYYLEDFMDEINISDISGELLLLSFDGQIIHSTYNVDNKNGDFFIPFNKILDNLEDRRSSQILDENENVIFFSSVLYNNMDEGYLLFISKFEDIFLSNKHLFESKEHHHSFLAINNGNVISEVGKRENKYITSVYPLETLPVSLQISTNESVIKEPTNRILFSIILISIISVSLLAIIFSIITSRLVTKPLSILENEINMVGSGEIDSVPYRKKDPIEIKFLRSSFNSMQKSIKLNKSQLEMSNSQLLKINSDLKSAQKQLVQSEKMASIGQLAAGVAHEINNPTGFVTTNLYTMTEYMNVYNQIFSLDKELYNQINEKVTDESITQIIKSINTIKDDEDFEFISEDSTNLLEESIDGVIRIKDIVTGLRNFARPESKITSLGNINDAIKDALRLTWNELKYKCTVEQNLDELPEVLCRLDQITQVFVNLFVNAAHAIEEHGIIKVKTWVEEKYIYASVEDNGGGIPPQNIEKLFDPFFTTKEVGKGTGLGLSISYGIIEEHGGEIAVRSKVGEGTAFTLTFKLHK